MNDTAVATQGLELLKGAKLPEGMYAVGEFRGFDSRESKGNMYFKIKVLLGDTVMKLDVKPDMVQKLQDLQSGAKVVVRYYKFVGRFGENLVTTDVIR